jgi:hypothetical protein
MKDLEVLRIMKVLSALCVSISSFVLDTFRQQEEHPNSGNMNSTALVSYLGRAAG